VELAQREAAMHWIGEEIVLAAATGTDRAPRGNRLDGIVPHDAFPCDGDDEWVAIAADDDAGLSLADTLLERPAGTSTSWGDLERSAVIETANIVGCAYLNAICAALGPAGAAGILPSQPIFLRDFLQGAGADYVSCACGLERGPDATVLRCRVCLSLAGHVWHARQDPSASSGRDVGAPRQAPPLG
jgi:hypothetical protein